MLIYQDLLDKRTKLAVIGLGYVGLPLALAFASKISVIGFDINPERIDRMKQGMDPSEELNREAFEDKDILFTSDPELLKDARFFIIAVPTPVTASRLPDLTAVQEASRTVGRVLKRGDYIVFESTVYPGCTEEDCLPLVEQVSGMQFNRDFKAGYSPERINPGDKVHTLSNTVKIVSGGDAVSLEEIALTYGLVVAAGVHRAPAIRVAEAGKMMENIQRDLNIALMNELSVIFDLAGIDTQDVIEAAATKWNFVKYYPGLVGGHCTGVDPYYLIHKARQLGYPSRVVAAGRSVNEDMSSHVANKVKQHITGQSRNLTGAKVLVWGATFKENVSDIRNSRVAALVHELQDYSLMVDFADLRASRAEVKREYGLELTDTIGTGYDAVVLAVAHDEYRLFTEEYLLSITRPGALFADLKGVYRNRFTKLKYWSL